MPNEKIVAAVHNCRPQNEILFVVRYGNRKGKDIDLLLVSRAGSTPSDYVMQLSGLDIYQITLNDLLQGVKLADPVITEPLLTGHLLSGDQSYFVELKTELKTKEISEAAIQFLYKRSKEELVNAKVWMTLCSENQNNNSLCYCLLSLTFALSYYLFAKQYQACPNQVITLKKIRQQKNPLFEKALYFFKTAKNGKSVSSKVITQLGLEAEKILEGG